MKLRSLLMVLGLLIFLPLFIWPPSVAARGGCFTAETEILTPDGPKPISSLKSGDLVLSLDLNSNQKQLSQISKVETFDESEYFLLNQRTKVTPTHPYYVLRDGQEQL